MIDVKSAMEVADAAWESAGGDPRAVAMELRVAHLIGQLDFEVNLGGVLGWLTNSSGRYGRETVAALEMVQAHTSAAILEKILAFFPDGKPSPDDSLRGEQIQKLMAVAEGPWRELGDSLLEWEDDMGGLFERYVVEHASAFDTSN